VTRVACRPPRIRPSVGGAWATPSTWSQLSGDRQVICLPWLSGRLAGVELKAAICTGFMVVVNHRRMRGDKKMKGIKPNNEII
jgi:hypothetical protein